MFRQQHTTLFSTLSILIFATTLTISVCAKESPAPPDTNTNLQIEMLKASIAEIKETQKLGTAKQDAQDAKIREADKNAIEANSTAKNTNETQKNVWMLLIGGIVSSLLLLVGSVYIGVFVLAKRRANTTFTKLMPEMLVKYFETTLGKKYLTDVMTPIAQAESLQQAEIANQKVSGAMLAAAFHNSGRQDLLEAMLSKLEADMPTLSDDLCKFKLHLSIHAYENYDSKNHYVHELATKALQSFPEDSEVLAANGTICTRMGKYDDALGHLRKAIKNETNERSKCVFRWSLAFCIQKKADSTLIDEGIAAARDALIQLPNNQKLKMTLINCQSLSESSMINNEAFETAKGWLHECQQKGDPVNALSTWRRFQPALQKRLCPIKFGFSQLMA